MSNADEILKLKELLDKEIITQEEFEKKKQELLSNNINKNAQINSNTLNKEIEEKKKISVGKIILIIFVILLCSEFIRAIQKSFSEIQNTSSNSQSYEVIFNANDYYNADRTNTVTIEELKAIKGEPLKIENWNYEINETTSYPITSVYYSNNEEYCFYNEHLAWILLENEISYKNKNSIIKMFGLEENSLTQKTADTGYALKYENCGVACLWIQGIENNTFNWAKIIYIDIFNK